MITKSQAKRKQDIKTKLMAAIAMLLVSSIMMVSSTYAWFTLSTAPEVTGINTAVGANGNLEIALLPKDGQTSSITSEVGDSTKAIEEKNVTWGNLVDLSDSTVYGLDQITLFPSALNLTDVGTLEEAMLKTPTYGADGRPSELLANTVTGYFDKVAGNFAPNDDYGVRAIGTASGMTPRQLDYRNARSAANTAKAQAANQASQSLNNNGSSLANIAIEYGMGTDTASFGKTDVESLRAIIDDLNGDGGVLDRIETAYMQYILAVGASAASGTEDTVWQAVSGAITADGATLDSVINALGEDRLPAPLKTAIDEYKETVAAVEAADTALQTLEAELASDENATFTWTEISSAMRPLADPANMTINGFEAGEVKDKLGELVSSVTAQGGLRVVMGTGAGVYADIADQSGDYTASITIESVEYNGIVLNNMNARMETASDVTPSYLEQIGAAVELLGAPQGTGNTVLPITDMYGYVIDLAFRTNAADSKLLLQVDAADRIYGADNTNEQTMGHGSSMTFQATTTDFSNDQIKSLMNAIRIVFFDPANGNAVVATAKLDTANATVGTDGVTAKIKLYEVTEGGTTTTYEDASAEQIAAAKAGTEGAAKLYTKGAGDTYTEVTDNSTIADDGEYYVAVTTTTTAAEVFKADDKQEIMPLTQNQAAALSVLVYLDGNLVGNDDVAATNATSMTGKMNIQFASSANLVPMDYAALNIPAGN